MQGIQSPRQTGQRIQGTHQDVFLQLDKQDQVEERDDLRPEFLGTPIGVKPVPHLVLEQPARHEPAHQRD